MLVAGCLLAFGAALTLGAAGALACSPTSAGDCQYTDPLSNTTTTTATHTAAPPPVTTAPATTPPATTPQDTAPVTTATDPTATIATATSGKKTLPLTGYDAWIGGALGVFLVAGGIAIRRQYAAR
jgi:hypothetical protein